MTQTVFGLVGRKGSNQIIVFSSLQLYHVLGEEVQLPIVWVVGSPLCQLAEWPH